MYCVQLKRRDCSIEVTTVSMRHIVVVRVQFLHFLSDIMLTVIMECSYKLDFTQLYHTVLYCKLYKMK